MQDRIQVEALRSCSLRVKWTDENNNEIKDDWIFMDAGESRVDFQYIMALDPTNSDLPDEYDFLSGAGLQTVIHPRQVGESFEAFGLIRVTRLS